MSTSRVLTIIAALAAASVIAACGSDEPTSADPESARTAEAAFIAQMVPHHEGAIEMARLAEKRAEHPEVREMATGIITAQEKEIAVLDEMGAEYGEVDGSGNSGMDSSEMGMDFDLSALAEAEPFDRAFIDAMIPHHEGAIAMAEQLLEAAEDPELRDLAQEIISAQTAEIEQMREWRAEWYGSSEPETGAGPHEDMGH